MRLCVFTLRLCENPPSRTGEEVLAETQSEDAESQGCNGSYAAKALRRMITTWFPSSG